MTKEVKSYLKNTIQFIHSTKPIVRGSSHKLKYGFFVRDRNYSSARWPGVFTALPLNLQQCSMSNERLSNNVCKFVIITQSQTFIAALLDNETL